MALRADGERRGVRWGWPRRLIGFLLVVLFLGAVFSRWLPSGGRAWAQLPRGVPIEAYEPEPLGFEAQLMLFSDSLRWNAQLTDCPPEPQTPFSLPPRPAGPALGLIPADGRPARWSRLLMEEQTLYWPLDEALDWLGATLDWDPLWMSGALAVDSLHLRFAAGSEIVHGDSAAWQLQAPILYARNRLLLPLDFATVLLPEWLEHRLRVAERPLRLIARPPGARVRDLRLGQARGRTVLAWTLPAEPEAKLLTDGVRALAVCLPGVFIDPTQVPAVGAAGDLCWSSLQMSTAGSRFYFRVPPGVVAWRTEWRAASGEFRLLLSRQESDLGRWTSYRRWPRPAPGGAAGDLPAAVLGGEAGGEERAAADRLLLLIVGERAAIDAPASRLAELAARCRDRLSRSGIATEILSVAPDGELHAWAARANARRGFAALVLVPDAARDSLAVDARLVTASSHPDGRPLIDLAEEAERLWESAGRQSDSLPRPALGDWDRAVPRHALDSAQLAWLLREHLDFLLRHEDGGAPEGNRRRASWQNWPSGRLEGFDLPAVQLYLRPALLAALVPRAGAAALAGKAEAAATEDEAERAGGAPGGVRGVDRLSLTLAQAVRQFHAQQREARR